LKNIIIAIDGYAGTGKSSTAKAVAKELGYLYLDSGSMYRAVTWFFIQNNIQFHEASVSEDALDQIQLSFEIVDGESRILLNGKMLDSELRSMEVNQQVSEISSIAKVREKLVEKQQAMGRNRGIVMDGRDIGTVVFPQADIKVFMTASVEVRGKRRQKELKEKGIHSNLSDVIENLKTRDQQDTQRAVSPLRKAEGALEIDTSDLTFEQQVKMITDKAKAIMHES